MNSEDLFVLLKSILLTDVFNYLFIMKHFVSKTMFKDYSKVNAPSQFYIVKLIVINRSLDSQTLYFHSS